MGRKAKTPVKKFKRPTWVPESLTILGRKYTIEFMTAEKLADYSGTLSSIACVCNDERKIVLREDHPRKGISLSIFHEAIHAAQYVSGLDQVIPPELQEIYCESLGNMVVDLFEGFGAGSKLRNK